MCMFEKYEKLRKETSALIEAWESETLNYDRQTDQPTNRHTGMRGHWELLLPITFIRNVCSLDLGGSRITTGTSFSTALNLWLGYSLKVMILNILYVCDD